MILSVILRPHTVLAYFSASPLVFIDLDRRRSFGPSPSFHRPSSHSLCFSSVAAPTSLLRSTLYFPPCFSFNLDHRHHRNFSGHVDIDDFIFFVVFFILQVLPTVFTPSSSVMGLLFGSSSLFRILVFLAAIVSVYPRSTMLRLSWCGLLSIRFGALVPQTDRLLPPSAGRILTGLVTLLLLSALVVLGWTLSALIYCSLCFSVYLIRHEMN